MRYSVQRDTKRSIADDDVRDSKTKRAFAERAQDASNRGASPGGAAAGSDSIIVNKQELTILIIVLFRK